MKSEIINKNRYLTVTILILTVCFSTLDCSSQPPSINRPPVPTRNIREYPVDEAYEVFSDRVIENDKTAIALNSSQIRSDYGTRTQSWELSEDISRFPQLKTQNATLVEALYNMALEEAVKNIRSDGAFNTGEKWTGTWTRDISYSTHLSLAYILPEECMESLRVKVNEEGEIIQDTGTGGSWPISTDRVSWILAAWEIYISTQSTEWLEYMYPIAKRTIDRDLIVAWDSGTGLFYGETSFLDWREQTYPKWMQPKDIFESKSLSTNLLMAEALNILAKSSRIIQEIKISDLANNGIENRDTTNNNLTSKDNTMQIYYQNLYKELRDNIQEYFYNEESNTYSLFLYPPIMGNLPSEKTDSLGNCQAVIFGLTEDKGISNISASLPIVNFGIPTIYPQQPGIPPYHNRGIWPFVESYYLWTAVIEKNEQAVNHSFNALSRAAAMFLSHMENFVYDTGNKLGTETNSPRQLWSVAGYLECIYRGVAGIDPTEEGIYLHPVCPELLKEGISLTGFRIGETLLNITTHGYGSVITNAFLNGEEWDSSLPIPFIPGEQDIELFLEPAENQGSINLVPSGGTCPKAPLLRQEGSTISWRSLTRNTTTRAWNGIEWLDSSVITEPQRGLPWALQAVDNNGFYSNLTKWVLDDSSDIIIEAEEAFLSEELTAPAEERFSGTNYVKLNSIPGEEIVFTLNIPESGTYYIRFLYANGNGPINTNNKCCLRTLVIDDKWEGPLVMPQRGSEAWSDFGWSNGTIIELEEGSHTISVIFKETNRNMNGFDNFALIDNLCITMLEF